MSQPLRNITAELNNGNNSASAATQGPEKKPVAARPVYAPTTQVQQQQQIQLPFQQPPHLLPNSPQQSLPQVTTPFNAPNDHGLSNAYPASAMHNQQPPLQVRVGFAAQQPRHHDNNNTNNNNAARGGGAATESKPEGGRPPRRITVLKGGKKPSQNPTPSLVSSTGTAAASADATQANELLAAEPAPEPAPEPVPETASEPAPEPVSEPASEPAPEPATETTNAAGPIEVATETPKSTEKATSSAAVVEQPTTPRAAEPQHQAPPSFTPQEPLRGIYTPAKQTSTLTPGQQKHVGYAQPHQPPHQRQETKRPRRTFRPMSSFFVTPAKDSTASLSKTPVSSVKKSMPQSPATHDITNRCIEKESPLPARNPPSSTTNFDHRLMETEPEANAPATDPVEPSSTASSTPPSQSAERNVTSFFEHSPHAREIAAAAMTTVPAVRVLQNQSQSQSPSHTSHSHSHNSHSHSQSQNQRGYSQRTSTSPGHHLSPSNKDNYFAEIEGHFNRRLRVIYPYTNPVLANLSIGDYVVTEGDRGEDLGRVISISATPPMIPVPTEGANGDNGDQGVLFTVAPTPSSKILRRATEAEVAHWAGPQLDNAIAAVDRCADFAERLKLPLFIVSAVYQFDEKKLTFLYESSQSRVDFRKLLVELYNEFKCRIWMERVE